MRLLVEYVDRVLADVFQGRKPELREHLLGVAAKVSRKHPWPYFEECVEAEVGRRLATRPIPPEGWLPFGSLIDYDGPAECSDETGEDGLPLWERPVPPDLTTELADRLVVRANELLEDNDG
jgi:hypothetical protein